MWDGKVLLDGKKIRTYALDRGFTPETLAEDAHVGLSVVRSAFKGKRMQLDSAHRIATTLEVKSFLSVIDPSDKSREAAKFLEKSSEEELGIQEWEPVGPISKPLAASNGLQYKIWEMKHRHLSPAVRGRGKRYDLTNLSSIQRDRLREHLERHPKICRLVSPHPQIPRNETTCPDLVEEAWWVVDEWIPGKTLADRLEADKTLGNGGLGLRELARVMREIAAGLQILHENGVVRPELAPRFIILKESDGTVVLTDFELGKLLDKSPTVSEDWPGDEYRAPEVISKHADERADLYSWGRILVHAATGDLPEPGEEARALKRVKLKPKVLEITLKCVEEVCDDRPDSIDDVLSAIKGWR